MNDMLDIQPFTEKCAATVQVPGSKSISNRALILSALCNGEVTLSGVLRSEDVDLMINALVSLGIKVKEGVEETTLVIQGCGGDIPEKNKKIFVGNAGTIARFLTAFLAIQENAAYELDGTEAMRERPMGELLSFLKENGANLIFGEKEGCFPFTLKANNLKAETLKIDATQSSQVLSAILLILPFLGRKVALHFEGGTVSAPFVDITLSMIKSFSLSDSFESERSLNSVTLCSKGYRNDDFEFKIEPDATAASYFLTLPLAAGGYCSLDGIHREMLQGDSAYMEILEKIGMRIIETPTGVRSELLGAPRGGAFDFNDISDTFLSLAAISPLLSSPLKIYGIAHTRKQETDRVSAMASELRGLGQTVEETDDQLTITPDLNKLRQLAVDGVEVKTYEDHRFAMSFGIFASADMLGNGKSWLSINDPNCCAKTFPRFFQELESVRVISHK